MQTINAILKHGRLSSLFLCLFLSFVQRLNADAPAEPLVIAKLNQGGFEGVLLERAYGSNALCFTVALSKYPKNWRSNSASADIEMWILVRNGKSIRLQNTSPVPGLPPIVANQTANIIFIFDSFSLNDSPVVVLKMDSIYKTYSIRSIPLPDLSK